MFYLILIACFLATVILTPIVKILAVKIGATDQPNYRKVHQKVMPRLGGLAIFFSFVIGISFLTIDNHLTFYLLIGSTVIVLTGILDDVFELGAKTKLIGQMAAAAIVIFGGGIHMEFVSLPFGMQWNFYYLGIPMTFLWIIGVTNSINLIDGLDGLAAGVSSIALLAISGMAVLMGETYVWSIGFILLFSTLGFLPYNFHPAKIFLGDTGSLLLGFVISVLSLLGFKNVTFISLIVPIVILGVPLSDTFFAIVRRLTNKKPLTAPDKYHLHHCLLQTGLSHPQVVLTIYSMACLFAVIGVILTYSNFKGSYLEILLLLIIIELFAEKIGWVGKEFRPLLRLVRFFVPTLTKK